MKEKKVVFKRYVQNQPMLLPPSYEEMVPLNHPVRVVNEVMERIDIGALEASYKGGGTSSYHPRMLLKVMVYAYLRNVYSSRKIEQALSERGAFHVALGRGEAGSWARSTTFVGSVCRGI